MKIYDAMFHISKYAYGVGVSYEYILSSLLSVHVCGIYQPFSYLKARFTLSRLWGPMAKSAGFVSTSANSEGTSVFPGTSSDIGNEGPMFGQHRQAARKERTCLLILGMSGVNRFIGVHRVISGRERKRTQVLRDFSRGTSAIFVNVPRFIVFYRLFIGNLTHTRKTPDRPTTSRGSVESIPWGNRG